MSTMTISSAKISVKVLEARSRTPVKCTNQAICGFPKTRLQNELDGQKDQILMVL